MTSSLKETILIVDDVPENLTILSSILAPTYTVLAAKNGKKALEIANKTPGPDLILLDVVMPDVNGLEICGILKSDPLTKDIPVIFVTSQNEVFDEARGFEAGAVDYLIKPVNPLIVRARVKTHLALSSATREKSLQNHILQENIRLLEQIEQIARHDLKSPLTIFMNASDYMEREKNLTPDQLSFLKMLDGSAVKMLRMIDRSLDLVKMEQGRYKVKPVPIDMVKLVVLVSKELESLAEVKNVEVRAFLDGRPMADSDSCPLQGEEHLLSSIVSNLLKNALEASPKGGKVAISLINQDPFVIEIRNQGVIPPQIQARFFERYATFGKQEGTGLGSFSARLMARTLGGDIQFVTNKESGTILRVSIPREGPGAPIEMASGK